MPSSAVVDTPRQLALVVFLENTGHVSGLALPSAVRRVIDYVTEEYAKLLLRVLGAYGRYDRIVVLEDDRATGRELSAALLEYSRTHQVDLLLLVHGQRGQLVGHAGQESVDGQVFDPLIAAYKRDPDMLNLRVVYGLNCYGASLVRTWLELGAQACNGAVGVNWFPEPSLSLFLFQWLRGRSFSHAVVISNHAANRLWSAILPNRDDGRPHPWVDSSRQVIYGRRDISIRD